jgi:hypothetical protein
MLEAALVNQMVYTLELVWDVMTEQRWVQTKGNELVQVSAKQWARTSEL